MIYIRNGNDFKDIEVLLPFTKSDEVLKDLHAILSMLDLWMELQTKKGFILMFHDLYGAILTFSISDKTFREFCHLIIM